MDRNGLHKFLLESNPKHRRTAKQSAHQTAGGRIWAYCSSRDMLYDTGGIIIATGALLVYGVLQERIVTFGFGRDKEVFEHSIFLVLCNRLVTCIMALGYLLLTRTATAPAAPLRSYAAVSLTNVIATACQYEALRYVSFAIQTLAKSAKALPVMLWSTLYMRKIFKVTEYLHAATITIGCSVFVLTGHVRSRVADAGGALQAMSGVGLGMSGDAALVVVGGGLMVLYLFVDGLTSTWQDSMFRGYPVNVCDQLLPALAFLQRNPEAALWILGLSAASAVVQLVISWTIKRYGAVVFATIMTTRQFFSILLSCMVFMTPLTIGQWAGTLLVFGAIYYKAAQKCAEHQHLHVTTKEEDDPPSPPGGDGPETTPLKIPLLAEGIAARYNPDERRHASEQQV
ncbi:hypothetical protein VOLCADRAFT_104315 [Volvox carteri f. nagariensis]|uniref:Uncharacterized protein n=1 Tax=Volvox carteri f. nagariensis TaxID=3068 RepID=D8TST8_VOLCA|nr:uncharacterized protein VOLCADRAFT_104315 [Volvox carteri f. nagariensis]EFJ49432.1 hypothetical protein VOLCADRAFT_104315 [Volvox carteri f. nagariensis]|eukprot:XP_002949413.1 hypothetical protein VOLCADRAFT_104315 [Volvox carteri f. nagariensis]